MGWSSPHRLFISSTKRESTPLSWASPDIKAASPGRIFNKRKRIRVIARMVGINWRMRRRANLSIF
jgi:hypothetical protein